MSTGNQPVGFPRALEEFFGESKHPLSRNVNPILLFIVSAIGDVKMMPLVSEVFPFLLITLGVLLLATLYPPIATWMPSLIH